MCTASSKLSYGICDDKNRSGIQHQTEVAGMT